MKQTFNKWFFIIASLAGYILFARFRYLLVFKGTHIVAFWIPVGISLAILLLKGYRYIPLIFIGNYFVAAIISVYDGFSFINTIPPQLSSSILNTVEATLGFYLILKISKSHLILNSFKNSISFIYITFFISLVTAFFGTLLHCYFNNDWFNFPIIFYSWWINDGLGILLITPFIMGFPKKLSLKIKSSKTLEFAPYLIVLFLFLFVSTKTQYPVRFLLFPILLVGLFRFGKFIGFATILAISFLVAFQNSDYQIVDNYYENKYLIIYQLYFSVACILILIVSALIEDQKNKEKELIKNQKQFKSIFNSINESIIICDSKSGKILDVNKHACDWLGYSRNEFKNMGIDNLTSNTHTSTKEKVANYFKKSQSELQNFKWQIKDKLNKVYYCDIQMSKASIFEKENIIVTIRDDSEKHKLEQEVIHAYIEAQEDEKQYFGEEIHDNIIQTLAAEQIFINAIDKTLVKDKDKAAKYIKKLNELNHSAIDAIQNIAYGLMSKQLKENGLILSLENLCIDMSLTDKVEFNFSHKNIRERDMSDAIKTNVFRILQELTNNCTNYSNATIANLYISKTSSQTLEIIFSDNDNNLNIKTLENIDDGRSMKNIYRRLKYLDGDLVINSESTKGLEIKITIPLS